MKRGCLVTMVGMFLLSLCTRGFTAEGDVGQKVDPEKAKAAVVVLRVKLVKAASEIRKYGYDEVKVLEVYKNEPKAQIPEQITIAFRNTDSGVPKGESTVYLVDYHTPPEGKMWLLAGTSHVEAPTSEKKTDKPAEQTSGGDSSTRSTGLETPQK